VFTLEELQDAARGVNELNWRGHEHDARETDRITLQNRVIPTSAGPGAVSRYFFVELRLRPRRHWRNILFRGEAFGAAGALVLPDSREVSFGCGRRWGLRRGLLLTGLGESS